MSGSMNTPPEHKKRASLHTLGCRLNQSESLILQEQLQAQGYEIVPYGDPADLAIVNTCTVTNDADTKSRKAIRGFIRENPDAYMAVIGCYSQMGSKTLSEIPGVDLIIGNQEKMNVLSYIQEGKNEKPLIVRDRIVRDDFTIDTFGTTDFTRRANLKIQDGCDFMCSFCIIPFARGRSRSRAMDNLLDEANQLIARGARELVLTGVNIGTYAYDGMTVLDVVDRLNEIDDLARIRISSIEPTTIPTELFDRMNDPEHALVPYLHIPLQSGADNVLQSMRRLYTRDEFIAFVKLAHDSVPDICIGTDVMVGAPGESEADFEDTCDLLLNNPISYAHVFKYSEREGTAALRIPGKVDGLEKNRRSAIIRRISGQKLNELHEKYLGKTVEVLFESGENGHWSGYTGNYIRVTVVSDDTLTNQVMPLRLDSTHGDFAMGTLQINALTEV
jgi:threonylcarbamoyladenosine tRNA methylthiotransferase MtaB